MCGYMDYTISGYIKYGLIIEARKLFDRVAAQKNVVMWTAMMSEYMRSNTIFEVEQLLKEKLIKNVVSWKTMMDVYI